MHISLGCSREKNLEFENKGFPPSMSKKNAGKCPHEGGSSMAIAIPMARVRQLLSGRIGTEMANSIVSSNVVSLLRQYRAGDDLTELAQSLRDVLFHDLYKRLGPRMNVTLPDGQSTRIRLEELPVLADDLLGVLFEALGTAGMPKETLMSFAMQSGSLCAMRTLLNFYPLSEPERALLARIVRENTESAE